MNSEGIFMSVCGDQFFEVHDYEFGQNACRNYRDLIKIVQVGNI